MSFKLFLETRLKKDLEEKFQIQDIGTIGWWKVSVASENENFGQGFQSNNLDNFVKTVQSLLPNLTREAVQKMSYLGFRSEKHNLIIDNGTEKRPHTITGDMVHPTYASFQRHSIKIHLSDLDVNTLIHEHAHMTWKNLPKYKKDIFIKWYNNKKSQFTDSPQFHNSFKVPKTEIKGIENHFFKNNIARIIVYRIVEALHNETTNQYLRPDRLSTKLLRNHSDGIPVRSKKHFIFESSYGRKEINPGDIIDLRYFSDRYILELVEKPNNEKGYYKTFEYPKSLYENELDDYIEVDEKLITQDKYVERLKSKPKLISNTPPISYYTPENKKEEIKKIINDSINNFLEDQFHGKYTGNIANPTSIFNSFRAKLRLRKNKIEGFEDVWLALNEVLQQKVFFDNVKYSVKYAKEQHSLGNPEYAVGGSKGNIARDSMQKLFNLPSSYAASNVDELFAEVVSYAAKDLKLVTKELRNMLFEVLH